MIGIFICLYSILILCGRYSIDHFILLILGCLLIFSSAILTINKHLKVITDVLRKEDYFLIREKEEVNDIKNKIKAGDIPSWKIKDLEYRIKNLERKIS